MKILGSLDRVAHGLIAEDILHAADELVGKEIELSKNMKNI